MGTRNIVGAGAVWDSDLAFDDPFGSFKWDIIVDQPSSKVQTSFTRRKAQGGTTDTTDSFNADARFTKIPWEVSNGVFGELCEVACVTHSPGANGSWSIQGGIQAGGSSSNTGDTKSAGASIGFGHTFANAPDMAVWEFKFIAIPTSHGCPEIEIVGNFTSQNDPDFFWGDSLETGSGSSSVNSQPPQVYISSECNGLGNQWLFRNNLPLLTEDDVENVIVDNAIQTS